MSVVTVTDRDFDEVVGKASTPVLVDFWAEWCGPCKMAEPIIDELAEEYKGKVVMAKMNVDENQVKPAEFGVMSIPTVIAFTDAKEVTRKIGFCGKQGYVSLIEEVL